MSGDGETTVQTLWKRTLGDNADMTVLDPRATYWPKSVQAEVDVDFPRDEEASRRYVERGLLGQGGMGIVARASQVSLGREVAVKRLHPDPGSPESIAENHRIFVAEARIQGGLEHPNIVPVHDLSVDARGEARLVMKLVEGRSWEAVLRAEGLDLERDLDILLAVSLAMAYAHDRDVVHGDLKPSNVMLGSFGEVLVSDWGLAMAVGPRAPQGALRAEDIAHPRGTPCYMAPELANGTGADIGRATDVYLLGGILFRILAGKPPHSGGGFLQVAMRAAEGAPPRLDDSHPAGLREICSRALAAVPAERFPDAAAFREALLRWRQRRANERLREEARGHLEQARHDLVRDASPHAAYAAFTSAIALFGQAAANAPGDESDAARAELERARARFAEVAVGRGDLGLAELQAGRLEDTLAAPIRASVAQARRRNARRERARRGLRAGVIGLAGLVLLVASALAVVYRSSALERAAQNNQLQELNFAKEAEVARNEELLLSLRDSYGEELLARDRWRELLRMSGTILAGTRREDRSSLAAHRIWAEHARGLACLELGRLDEARAHLEEARAGALELDPTALATVLFRCRLGAVRIAWEAGQADSALALGRALLEESPAVDLADRVQAHRVVANLAGEAGRPALALACLESSWTLLAAAPPTPDMDARRALIIADLRAARSEPGDLADSLAAVTERLAGASHRIDASASVEGVAARTLVDRAFRAAEQGDLAAAEADLVRARRALLRLARFELESSELNALAGRVWTEIARFEQRFGGESAAYAALDRAGSFAQRTRGREGLELSLRITLLASRLRAAPGRTGEQLLKADEAVALARALAARWPLLSYAHLMLAEAELERAIAACAHGWEIHRPEPIAVAESAAVAARSILDVHPGDDKQRAELLGGTLVVQGQLAARDGDPEAVSLFEQAIATFDAGELPLEGVRARVAYARVRSSFGLDGAGSLLRAALDTVEATRSDKPARPDLIELHVDALRAHAEWFLLLGQPAAAAQELDTAVPLAASLQPGETWSQARLNEGYVRYELGLALSRAGDTPRAVEQLAGAIALAEPFFERVKVEPLAYELVGLANERLGRIFHTSGRPAEADACLATAARAYRELGSWKLESAAVPLAEVLELRAAYSQERGQLDDALAHAREASRLLFQLREQLPMPDPAVDFRHARVGRIEASLLAATGDTAEAHRLLGHIDALLGPLRGLAVFAPQPQRLSFMVLRDRARLGHALGRVDDARADGARALRFGREVLAAETDRALASELTAFEVWVQGLE